MPPIDCPVRALETVIPTVTVWRAFVRDRRGGMAPIFALGLMAMLGAATIGVDYARGVAMRQFLSNAADAAALAAVTRLPDSDGARDLALEYVEKNMPAAKYGNVLVPADVEFGYWDPETRTFRPVGGGEDDDDDDDDDDEDGGGSGGGVASAVRVTTRIAKANGNALNTLFAAALGSATMDLSAVAVAGRGGPPCILALDPAVASAMYITGTSAVETIGCGVQVNSTASDALLIEKNGSLISMGICVSGVAQILGGGSASPEPKEYCPGQSDPMAGQALPAYSGCKYKNADYKGITTTLQPGVYCGGLSISAGSNITLSSGTYVIKDGPLVVAGNATVTGSEVTLFLTGATALVNFKSGSIIDLTAPTNGDMEGVLIFQDPNFSGTHNWLGKSAANLRGVVYFPSGSLNSKSSTMITPEQSCTVLIAANFSFSTNSGASIDTTSADCRGALPGPYRRGIVLLQ